MFLRFVIRVCLGLMACPPGAIAQEGLPPGHPPVGPADVIRENQREHDMAESIHGRRALGEGPPLSTATADSNVLKGTIIVVVVDHNGKALPNVEVEVGILAQAGARSKRVSTTDGEGTARFSDLATGASQAYRVKLSYGGAVVGSMPFQLPIDQGYRVQLTKLPLTRNPRSLLLMGQTMLEFRDNRIHVIQQAQLFNLTEEMYVFPASGTSVVFPKEFTAFQSQEMMSDQRLEPNQDGFRLKGSLPPGPTTLAWTFDVPIHGTEQALEFPVPWGTYMYRVIVDEVEGLRVDVRGFPTVQIREEDGRRLMWTQLERKPGDPDLDNIAIQIAGIPGPGPLRWLALGIALAFLMGGLAYGLRGKNTTNLVLMNRRKQQLMEAAHELDRLAEEGQIGPKYKERRREIIVDELASILREEQLLLKTSERRFRAT